MKAANDYVVLTKLDSQLASTLVSEFAKSPRNVLSQLPSSAWPVMENSVGMELKLLPGGTFTMGEANTATAHQVTLTQPFYMGVHEVTQEQCFRVMGVNPSEFKGRRNPVEQVSWHDAVEFCQKLSSLPKEKSAGRVYRLPTEAEWEYACRAGTDSEYSFGNGASNLGEYGWFEDNSAKASHPVGMKRANGWGLYDMHGNVWEWCQDWYGNYPSDAVTDPTGPSSGSDRAGAVAGSTSPGIAGRRAASTTRRSTASATWASAWS